MTLKEFYEQIDSDYKDVIKRLCDEDMIKKFVFKFPEDPSFNDLTDGLKENDAEKAFCAVHTLKGVCSNLGFERLYEASYELTEKLRNRVIDNCDELYNKVERLYTDLIAAQAGAVCPQRRRLPRRVIFQSRLQVSSAFLCSHLVRKAENIDFCSLEVFLYF